MATPADAAAPDLRRGLAHGSVRARGAKSKDALLCVGQLGDTVRAMASVRAALEAGCSSVDVRKP
jgi:hypothetical protein